MSEFFKMLRFYLQSPPGRSMDASEVIRLLELQPHPREGGWFKEVYRSAETLAGDSISPRYGADRNCSTSIYYLITRERFSLFHRVKSDELFHFYLGDPATLCILSPEGSLQEILLGQDVAAGQKLQATVPAGCWQAIHMHSGPWALVGCTVSPGFDYADFEEANRENLLKAHPEHAQIICRLTSNSV